MVDIDELLAARGAQWGDAVATHVRIASAWSGVFGFEVQPVEVALAMIQLKTIRAANNPAERDSFDDIMGYCRIAMQIAGHPTPGSALQAQLPLEEPSGPELSIIQQVFGEEYGTVNGA